MHATRKRSHFGNKNIRIRNDEVETMAKLIKAGSSFRITIPRDLAKLLGWDETTEVVVHLHERDMLVVEKLDASS